MSYLVSVIIPTYKGEKNISRAIDSVLNQTHENVEIIVVDDNSPESDNRKKTEILINKYDNSKIRYIMHEKNKNGAVARNTGIKIANGDYITFLDDDDFMFPKRIEKSLNCLVDNSSFGAVYSSVILTSNSKIVGNVIADRILETKDILIEDMVLGTGSNIFISRKILDIVKGFDETFLRHQDLEFMVRVSRESSILNVNEFLVVKSTNGTDNTVDYVNLKYTKQKYFNKFEKEINEMNIDDINKYHENNASNLFMSSVLNKDKKYLNEAKVNLEKYRKLSIVEKIYYLLAKLNIITYFIYIYRCLRKLTINKKTYNLNKEEVKFIRDRI